MQTQSLSQLTGRKTIGNPADLLPKKKVELKTSMTDALGDLGLVIQKENEETEKLANAMIEDMKKYREMGKEPVFRTDELATEGMQPLQITHDMRAIEGIDSNIPTKGPVKLEASDALDVNSVTGIKNYITPPTYTNSCEVFTDPIKILDVESVQGPRSVMVDNGEVDLDQINKERELETTKNNTRKSETKSEGIDPDDDSDILALIAEEGL